MNPKVDRYLTEGCGRCPLGGTPQCKVNTWTEELEHLRAIVLSCGLTEELKWGVPCYTFQTSAADQPEGNVVLMSALKEYCALSFFKGTLLNDASSILDKPGKNTQSARLIRFTNVREIIEMEPVLKTYIYEAIEVEKAGLKVDYKEIGEFQVPQEFQNKLDSHPVLKTAFEELTPGRQRGYLLYFAAPKQSKTRTARVEKCMQQIFDGRGVNER